MSPSLVISTLVLECRAECQSLLMWVFPIGISAPVLLEHLRGHCCSCTTLLTSALIDVVGFVVELASSKHICSRCLVIVSVILA